MVPELSSCWIGSSGLNRQGDERRRQIDAQSLSPLCSNADALGWDGPSEDGPGGDGPGGDGSGLLT
ncbi:hypothetical protein EYF80_055436 [Liparis tanakae]|uniref:Uncharacterized protein n=1 Tax=Liparis tanakae TaxID=230148 RepID=A0A4Z2F0C2_9TELE|nr:hypothetical protein EYF80_055436 [Liparis tanakae]